MNVAANEVRPGDAAGPVSASLEAELRELARQRGVLVWLDKDGSYTGFADALRARAERGEFPWPVRCFRGSYLELMLDLEELEDGVGMTPLVVHVPGHNTDTVAETPLFELYRAGRQFVKALPTLIREAAHGRATTEAVDTFLGGTSVSVESADAWLREQEQHASRGDGPDLSSLSVEALFDDLRRGGMLASQLHLAPVADAVWRRAQVVLGIDGAWPRTDLPKNPAATDRAAAMSRDIAGWALCVEFVHDLRRKPNATKLLPAAALARPAVAACQQLARHLRERHDTEYARIADDVEPMLDDEIRSATAADLGRIDTFRFEDRMVLEATLDALHGARFTEARDNAAFRTEDRSFWAKYDRGRRIAWNLVALAARLGCAATDAQELLAGATTLGEAMERYVTRGHQVDAAHRQLEQARHQLPHLEIEETVVLRARLDQMRGVYRDWCDAVARVFNALCRQEGFLPPPALQQRTLFDDVVAPLAGDEPVAFFMVDALRFEMGQQLADSIAETRTADVRVDARLCELPSVTEVGMNVLAPVARNGKLTIDARDERILGFRAGTVRVDGPDARRNAMRQRVGGTKCPGFSLQEVLDRDPTSLRQAVAGAPMLVVHAEGIDKAGEKGVGLLVFDKELQDLRAAWRKLYEIGIKRFVFAADHGFLLHDEQTRNALAHGKLTDPQRRHVLSPVRREQTGEVTVSFRDLGYDGADLWVSFPDDARPFALGDRAKDFVHGGNSLQERVIPVVTVRHRHAAGSENVSYQIELSAGRPVAGLSCVTGKVRATGQASLTYGGPSDVELTLEAAEGVDVQVEIRDVHQARPTPAGVLATVEEPFQIYFQLTGDAEERVPVRLRHAARGNAVTPAISSDRFQVVLRTRPVTPAAAPVAAPTARATSPASPAIPAAAEPEWLEAFQGGARAVFRHLMLHGSINEEEATRLLGGARQFRAFSREIDDHARRAPFIVRVEMRAGTKCYVRGDR